MEEVNRKIEGLCRLGLLISQKRLAGWASGLELKPRPGRDARFGRRLTISLVFVLLCAPSASLFSSCQGKGGTNAPRGAHHHSVVLTWGASTSAHVVRYKVYRSGVSGGPYAPLKASLPTGTLTYTDTTVQVGRTYYYVVTAVDSQGRESAHSNEASALVPSP